MKPTEFNLPFYFRLALSHFALAFVIMGIIYLIGWRKSPKWKARFWWITFALAAVISCFVGRSLLLGSVFGAVTLVLYFKFGKSAPSPNQA
jgi:hypothetical protein